MSDNMQKKELIEKLEKISKLFSEARRLAREIKSYSPEDNYERKIIVPLFPGEYKNESEREQLKRLVEHEKDDAMGKMEALYKSVCAPKKPIKPIIDEFVEPDDRALRAKKSGLKIRSYLLIGIGAYSAFFAVANIRLFVQLVLGGIITAVCSYFWLSAKKQIKEIDEQLPKIREEALANYNKNKSETLAEYDSKVKEYEENLAQFEASQKTFIEQYREWRNIYIQHIEEEKNIQKQLEIDKTEAVNRMTLEKFVPVNTELERCNDLLSEQYLLVADTLIDLLKSGRADDLKEAINLYEDMVYREKQLQLEREIEEHRHQEEAQRQYNEERRYQEEKRFREKQERQRADEEKQRREDEERRHKEDIRMREREAEKQKEAERKQRIEAANKAREAENKQSRDTNMQCQRCAHVGKCNLLRPNCPSYLPR